MKNKMIKPIAVVFLALTSASAHAAIVYDGWQLNGGAGYLSTNIGHLNLSGGQATVDQTLTGGAVAVGNAFTESGLVYSSSYTRENSPGPTDFGFPANYTGNLGVQFVLPTLSGIVTSVSSTGFVTYAFNTPSAPIAMNFSFDGGTTWTTVASLILQAPSGGGIEPFLGGALANGTTDMLATFDPGTYKSGLLNDSSGVSLDPLVYAITGSSLQLFVHTQNTVVPGSETLINGGTVAQFTTNSDGSANLQHVPEPGSIFLMGLGMLGFGLVRRKMM